MSVEFEVTAMIAHKELELASAGYSPEQSSAAIKRARRWAESIAKKVEPNLFDQTFIPLFRASLKESEDWLSKVKKTSNKWAEGLEAIGVTVGPQTREAYNQWST